MKLETDRLFLYPIENDAMRALIAAEPDAETKQAYIEMLDGCLREPQNRVWYAVWLMELRNTPGKIVGDFCFKGLNADGMVEIGYGLRAGCCGKGLHDRSCANRHHMGAGAARRYAGGGRD